MACGVEVRTGLLVLFLQDPRERRGDTKCDKVHGCTSGTSSGSLQKPLNSGSYEHLTVLLIGMPSSVAVASQPYACTHETVLQW